MMINNIKNRLIFYYNYKIKKFFFLLHYTNKTINIDWDKLPLNRINLINTIITKFKLKNYLEVGCQNDFLFNNVKIENKTGVDPISGGTIRLTSDDFFRQNKQSFDIIFIDGLHEYKQLRRDVINSFNSINESGWILIHDLVPRNWLEEHVPRINSNWCGDIWKISFELMQIKEINFNIALIDMGVGIIKVNKKKVKLNNDFDYLSKKRFNYFIKNFNTLPKKNHNEILKWISQF